jgi:hypothetical protein
MTAKATPSAVIPSAPRVSQQQHSNAVRGALLKTAIAVPLSVVAFILLLAALFIFHLRRHRLSDDSSSDAENLNLSRQSSPGSPRSEIGINDVEKPQIVVPAPLSAPPPIFPKSSLRKNIRRDIAASPHQAFLMSASLRQNPVSSLDGTPNTVPVRMFRSLAHNRAVEPDGTVASPAVHLRGSPLSSSPLRKTLVREEDDEKKSRVTSGDKHKGIEKPFDPRSLLFE